MLELYTLADAERVIAKSLHKLRHIDTVVGVPRSGTLFAAFIATQLGVGLADLDTASRSMRFTKHGYYDDARKFGRVLLVEDIANSGTSILDALTTMQQTVKKAVSIETCALWTNPNAPDGVVDYNLGGRLPERYAFTWQMWHSGLIEEWCYDFDGVFCDDSPHPIKNADEVYRLWAETATAKWLPRPKNQKLKVGAIITSRPEGIRAQTEAWLARHGVNYHKLVMVPVETQAEVQPYISANKFVTRGGWKAAMVMQLERQRDKPYELFIESHVRQALDISGVCRHLLVWCTDEQIKIKGGTVITEW